MATIFRRTYENIYGHDVVFKRLRTEVTIVNRLLESERTGTTIDTQKPWVGKIDERNGNFELVKTNPTSFLPFRYMDGNFFIIFIQGKVLADGEKARIEVKYKLDWFTVAGLSLIFTFTGVLTFQSVYNHAWDELNSLMFMIVVFVLTPLVLLIVQFRMTDKKILKLLGAEL
jgi:hypothetical protein